MWALYCCKLNIQMRIHPLFRAKKKYHNISDWYQTDLGQFLLDELSLKLEPVLSTSFGYYSLQIGCPTESKFLLRSCRVRHHFNLDRDMANVDICSRSGLLPIANDSVDLVIIMHHLSTTDEPHALLREVSRIMIPQGKLIIIDFNPLSLWGLRHFFQSWLEQVPWGGHYFSASRLKDWMQLLGFDLQSHLKVGYLPPIQQPRVLRHLSWLEKGMRNWFKFSSALNVLVFERNVVPLTPNRARWLARKIIPANVATRPTAGRGMKFNRK